MWVNGKYVKENWHAKKKTNKLREMKKSGNNIPVAIRKQLDETRDHFYYQRFIRENHEFKGKLKVSIFKRDEEVFKGGTSQKMYSLKAIKDHYGDGEYAQQYYNNARIMNNPGRFKSFVPYGWVQPDGHYRDGLRVARNIYEVTVESSYRDVTFKVTTNPGLTNGGYYSKDELLTKFTDKDIQARIEYVSRYTEVTRKAPGETATVKDKKFRKYVPLDDYYDKEYRYNNGHFKKKGCPKERGTLHNQLKAIAQTCNKALQNKSFDEFDSEIDTLSSLEPQVLPKDYHYWK